MPGGRWARWVLLGVAGLAIAEFVYFFLLADDHGGPSAKGALWTAVVAAVLMSGVMLRESAQKVGRDKDDADLAKVRVAAVLVGLLMIVVMVISIMTTSR